MFGFPLGPQRFLFGGLTRFRNCDRRNLAVLKAGRDCWQWIVLKCCHCGGRHVHGGGFLREDPRSMLGHRNQYCCRGGYVIVDENPTRTLELMGGAK